MSERGFSERGFSERGFSDELRAVLMTPPSDETARLHLSSMLAASRGQHQPITTPPRRDLLTRARSLALKLSVATSGLLAATTGLAYAGVDIPGTAPVAVVEAVLPVDLPNQDRARSDEVHAVQSATPKGGCEYGQAVSDAANGDHGSDNAKDPCAEGSDESADDEEAAKPEGSKKDKKPKKEKGAKADKENPSDGNKADAEANSNGHSSANEAPNGPKEPKPEKTKEPKEPTDPESPDEPKEPKGPKEAKENPSDGNKADAEANSNGHAGGNPDKGSDEGDPSL